MDIYNDEFKAKFINRALDEIWFDEQFQEMYKPVIITNKKLSASIFTWAFTHYLQNLDSSEYKIKDIKYKLIQD